MEDKLQNLRKAMDSTTHNGKHFTEVQKAKIKQKIRSVKTSESHEPKKHMVFGFTAAALSILVLLVSTEFMITPSIKEPNDGSTQALIDDWEIRNEYEENGEVLFSVYPDPGLSAEKPYGYLFNFTAPFDTFEGKELAIYAVHKETGERITVLAPNKVVNPPSGYSSLERFTTNFAVPAGGIWKYEVFVDDQLYGNVIVSVREKQYEEREEAPINKDWEITPTFTVKTENGERVFQGIEGEIAFMEMEFKVGQEGKTRWFIWGEDLQEVNRENLVVIATHKDSQEEKVVIDSNHWEVSNPEYEDESFKSILGAQASQHAVFSLPSSGLWRLDAYVGKKHYRSIIVEVEK
ncbi:DUF4871 domain-containing protein [Salipaludibacillus sp. CF4.18]|uniref:DUF4871 domain-containing protein n=1 Tax=Salipaludibacillus sp. CF4.18 TaxID=3373081 RepID=UPI003EE45EA5